MLETTAPERKIFFFETNFLAFHLAKQKGHSKCGLGNFHFEVVKKSWDRLPACQFTRISDRLEAYPTQ